MTMNVPICYECDDYTYLPGGFQPGISAEDKGKVQLTANVPKWIAFRNISVASADNWIFRGIPLCYNPANELVGHDINGKTGAGFWVTAIENATFEYSCVRL